MAHTIKTTSSKLPKSLVEIKGEIAAEHVAEFRRKAIAKIGQHAEMPGFRKGHVPEATLVSKLGEVAIIEEAAEMILDEHFPSLLSEHKTYPIGRPQVALTKVAPNNPVAFTVTFAVVPEVKLADYKKIAKEESAKEVEKMEVSEKEIDEVIQHIRETHAHNAAPHDHTHDAEGGHSHDLPEWTEEFVKTLGDFASIQDFRDKAKENIRKEKELREADKKRAELIARLVKESEIDVPDILVESEQNKMEAQFHDDIERLGLKVEDYLKHIKKTAAELRTEWKPDAENRAKTQLILNKIAVEENLLPSKEDVEKEVKIITERYKEANPESARIYVETTLANDKVLRFLEGK